MSKRASLEDFSQYCILYNMVWCICISLLIHKCNIFLSFLNFCFHFKLKFSLVVHLLFLFLLKFFFTLNNSEKNIKKRIPDLELKGKTCLILVFCATNFFAMIDMNYDGRKKYLCIFYILLYYIILNYIIEHKSYNPSLWVKNDD